TIVQVTLYYKRYVREVVMRRLVLIVLAALCISILLHAEPPYIVEADQLHKSFQYKKALDVLQKALPSAPGDAEKAEVLWRLARETLYIADDAEEAGADKKSLMDMYNKGAGFADQAVGLSPKNYNAIYWKASNIGKWGQLKGVLNALTQAKAMKEFLEGIVLTIKQDHPDSYYVLGQLYEKVPGIISFGDKDISVLNGRVAVYYLQKEVVRGIEEHLKYDYYTELARHLYNRNWSSKTRNKKLVEQRQLYKESFSEEALIKDSAYYRSSLRLADMSDRDEARYIINWVIQELEKLPNPDKARRKDLKKAKAALIDWGG
ncbi:MAG: hypothetical protein AB1798_04035, partial [Spirochaetota bacterium]